MRTFVRVLAIIAVFGIGLLHLFAGALLMLDTVGAPGSDSAPLSTIDQILKATEPGAEQAMQQKTLSAWFSMVAGLILTFSGIILAAVRPRQRQVFAKPVLGNAAVLASMARARPAVAPAPDPMPGPQAPPARPAAPTLQGAMPASAAPEPHAMKTTLGEPTMRPGTKTACWIVSLVCLAPSIIVFMLVCGEVARAPGDSSLLPAFLASAAPCVLFGFLASIFWPADIWPRKPR